MFLKSIFTCVVAICVAGTAIAAPKKHEQRGATAFGSGSAQTVFRDPCADPYAVCAGGTYIGRDPDPRVRARILSDFQTGAPNG